MKNDFRCRGCDQFVPASDKKVRHGRMLCSRCTNQIDAVVAALNAAREIAPRLLEAGRAEPYPAGSPALRLWGVLDTKLKALDRVQLLLPEWRRF